MASIRTRVVSRHYGVVLGLLVAGASLPACGKDGHSGAADSGASAAGATSASGGASTSGASNAGSSNGASSNAGASNAGASNAGASHSSGGTSSGGSSSGGRSNGGSSNAGSSNGGSSNAGSSAGDASTDGGADPCATARFCEDFESYTTGKAPGGGWKTSTNLGTVNVVDGAHFSGSKSVECATQAGMNGKTAFMRLDLASVFPVPGDLYYGRMMTRLESAPDTSVHWTFVQSSGLVIGQNYHAVYRYGGQVPVMNGSTFVGTKLMANYDTPDNYSGTGPASDCWNHSDNVVMPVAKWTCVEWEFDGPNDTLRFWLDGKAIDSLTVAGTGQGCVHQDKTYEWKAPSFADVSLGWESYQMDTARTLYVDDVVISEKRIGCPAQP
jgi:hypothetical protein